MDFEFSVKIFVLGFPEIKNLHSENVWLFVRLYVCISIVISLWYKILNLFDKIYNIPSF